MNIAGGDDPDYGQAGQPPPSRPEQQSLPEQLQASDGLPPWQGQGANQPAAQPQAPQPGGFAPVAVGGDYEAAGWPPAPEQAQVAREMSGMRPWAMLVGIIGSIFTSLVLVATVSNLFDQVDDVGGMIFGIVMVVVMILLILLFGWAITYAIRIGRYLQSQTPEALEAALEAQLRFWSTLGMLAILYLVVYLLFFLLFLGLR